MLSVFSNLRVKDGPLPIYVDANIHHKLPDAELIQLCLANDERAWRVMLDRYGGLIYSIAWQHVAPDDVADVFQSACLAMVQGLGRLKDASRLSSWVAAITRRQCYRIRGQRSWKRLKVEPEGDQLANLPDDAALPDETLQKLEQARLLRQAVSMLDEPCRRLMTRLFYEEEPPSYHEIAQQMHWPVSAIGPKRGRCLKRLRRVLDQIGF